MDISLKRTGRLLSSEKPAALRHFITSESGLSQVSASKTSWPQEMPRMLWNFSGRNFRTFCQSWTRMLNLHRYNHPNQGARIQWGEVETCWKPQIWAGFIFCVNVWKTIKVGFQATDMVNRSGHLLRTRHEAHRSFHNSWGLALQDANNLLTRHFKELSRSPQFASMVHAAQRCRSVVSIQIYQLLGSRFGRVTHSQNGLPLHSKKSGRNCSWPAMTLACLFRSEIHLTVIAHAAVAVSDGGSSNRWTKMLVKASLQGLSATRPWLHDFAHSSNIGSKKNVWCGIPQILRNMNVLKENV